MQGYLDSGALVPDELTCEIVADRTAQADCGDGYILDGFPRSQAQAEALQVLLANRGEEIDVAVDLDVPDEEIIERLSARRVCPTTGKVYNLKYNPPPPEMAGKVIQRADDQPETIRERLRVYHETTEPILGYYRGLGLLTSVSASGLGPDEVYAKVKTIVDEVGSA